MSEAFDSIGRAVDAEPMAPSTRRQLMGVTAAAVGGMGLFGLLSDDALAASKNNDIQTILNVATTAEVLATIVNTVAYTKNVVKTPVTRRNVGAAAQEELAHYNVLGKLGGRPFTKTIWIPDSVFASEADLLNTLVAGDQIFVNAHLIGVGAFAKADPKLAAVPAEFMGAEAVHHALALQSLGKLGNDRIFMKVDFTDILDAVALLMDAGFGFGRPGKGVGGYYKFDDIKKTTPTDPDVNTPNFTPIDA
jgi:hypothetical protein